MAIEDIPDADTEVFPKDFDLAGVFITAVRDRLLAQQPLGETS